MKNSRLREDVFLAEIHTIRRTRICAAWPGSSIFAFNHCINYCLLKLGVWSRGMKKLGRIG